MNSLSLEKEKGDILVVDDNLANIQALSEILAGEGFAVRGVRDGVTALKIIQVQPPDLILLDVQMPGMDGFTLCQQLKNQPHLSQIPVIFVSALDAIEDKVKGFAVGGVDYISKPFQAEEALARVRTHLTLSRLQRQLEQRVEERTAEIRRQNRELALLNKVIAASAASLSQESILDMVCRELALAFHMPQAAAFLANDDRTALKIVAEYRAEGRPTILNEILRLEEEIQPLVRHLLTSRTPLVVDDAGADPRLAPAQELIRRRSAVSLLIIPFIVKDEVVGAFSLGDINPRRFSPEEINLAWNVANQMAGALARARLEAEQRELQSQYHQAQKMEAVGLLAGGIAHDFNNLLTAINGFAELMQAELQPDNPLQQLITPILNSGQRATRLTRQLLVFSRKQMIEPHVLDLNKVASEADQMLRRIIGEDVEVHLELAPDLWPVKADPAQIEQIIVNLAVNARDAMPQGGRLAIQLANTHLGQAEVGPPFEAEPGEYVLLAVSDTGCGMSQAIQARIFEPFFTTKEPGKGTGLGLPTVFGIVKQNRGLIQVESEENRGTTFKVYWPRLQAAALVKNISQADTPLPTGVETILVVEDEASVGELVQRTLQGQGYNVLIAQNGLQALGLFEQQTTPIQLLITDMVMPGMSGRDLAAQLLERQPGLAVLFMSGYTSQEQEKGLPETAFIQKPFSPRDDSKSTGSFG